jgi:hypothetical protein
MRYLFDIENGIVGQNDEEIGSAKKFHASAECTLSTKHVLS